MPRRRKSTRQRYDQHVYLEPPSPPAQNWFQSVTGNIPAVWAIGVLFAAGAWYMATQNSTKEVEVLKLGLSDLTKTIASTTKEQDERRAALGKEFLSSNKEIVGEIGKLSTAIAIQQTQAKATSDAMTKISEQLQQLNAPKRR